MRDLLHKLSPETYTIIIGIMGILGSILGSFLSYSFYRPYFGKPKSLENQLQDSLGELQRHSTKTLHLLEQLQHEVTERQNAIINTEAELSRLKQQKTLLDLTDEQRQAIQSLLKRQPTVREIFTSKEFWLGRVLVSTIFFILGLAAGHWLKG